MNEEYTEVIIVDDDYYDDDYRNAVRDHRATSGGRRPSRRRPSAARPRPRPAVAVRRPYYQSPHLAQANGNGFGSGSIIRRDTGGLSTGTLISAGAQVLAAIQSLPLAPVATGEVSKDVENLMLYQAALAQHAKRDEQLRTIGSLASKLFA